MEHDRQRDEGPIMANPVGPENESGEVPAREDWIGHREIRAVDGALRPSAYVGRAYRHEREQNGRLPEWAQKQDNGRWRFSRAYVEEDARVNLESVGTDEAARILGTTKRTVQTWVDDGIISSASDAARTKGEPRRILRDQFMRDVPRLQKRLASSAADTPGVEAREETAVLIPKPCARDDGSPRESLQHGLSAIKAERAAAVEEQLWNAREARREEDRSEKLATEIAQRIMNDMFDDRLSRIEAMVLFNQAASEQGVPDEIRIRVRKGFWGK